MKQVIAVIIALFVAFWVLPWLLIFSIKLLINPAIEHTFVTHILAFVVCEILVRTYSGLTKNL